MTLLQEATETLVNLHHLTMGFSTGSSPDPHSVLGYQSKITYLHQMLGQEMARKFGAKESRYLDRKLSEAKNYIKGRIDLKKNASDSTRDALIGVEGEYRTEISSAEEYESYRSMLKSLDHAFSHTMQVVSFIGKSESRS